LYSYRHFNPSSKEFDSCSFAKASDENIIFGIMLPFQVMTILNIFKVYNCYSKNITRIIPIKSYSDYCGETSATEDLYWILYTSIQYIHYILVGGQLKPIWYLHLINAASTQRTVLTLLNSNETIKTLFNLMDLWCKWNRY